MEELAAKKLYEIALNHRKEHNCSAYPYEQYLKFQEIVSRVNPNAVLEIGTGVGFTSILMASVAPKAIIETVEKDQDHVQIARDLIKSEGFEDRITVTNAIAEIYLPDLVAQTKLYDLIFFDGYQIHYEFLPSYEKLLKPGGILILANTQLTSKTSDKFFDDLQHDGNWEISDQFNDTIVAHRI